MTASNINAITPFLPQTQVYPEDESQRLIVHTNVYTNISNAVNNREISMYPLQPIVSGQRFFDPNNPQNQRFGFRSVYQLGAVASGATATIAHNIPGTIGPVVTTTFTDIYGTCITDIPDYRPLPYTDETNVTNQISIKVVGANIVIGNGATAPNITSGIIVLEYLLN